MDPKIVDPIYHEMLLEDNYAFIRTGNRIYCSNDSLKTWKVIYEGKRGIKNSMVWIEREKALLFSEYTPGEKYSRHHLFKYFTETGGVKVIVTFYTKEEHEKKGYEPYCRHIHVLQKDPFTSDIYMGVGDSDDESAILRSSDNGNTFTIIGRGSQDWRTLSFLFTSTHVLWNTDTGCAPQYLHALSREKIKNLPIKISDVQHYPLINSACWNSFYDESNGSFIMSSSCEGMHYDKKNRVYAIKIDSYGKPEVYSIFEDESCGKEPVYRGHQLFVLGKEITDRYWFYDTRKKCYRLFCLNYNKHAF